MRRPAVPVIACALVLLLTGLAAGAFAPRDAPARAQDETPATVAPVDFDGVTTKYLGNGMVQGAPSDNVLEIVRVTLDRDASIVEDGGQLGWSVINVERGAIEVTTESEGAELLRPEGGETPAVQEANCAEGCRVEPGGSVVLPNDSRYTIEHGGGRPAVLFVASLSPESAVEDAATAADVEEGAATPAAFAAATDRTALRCDGGCR